MGRAAGSWPRSSTMRAANICATQRSSPTPEDWSDAPAATSRMNVRSMAPLDRTRADQEKEKERAEAGKKEKAAVRHGSRDSQGNSSGRSTERRERSVGPIICSPNGGYFSQAEPPARK